MAKLRERQRNVRIICEQLTNKKPNTEIVSLSFSLAMEAELAKFHFEFKAPRDTQSMSYSCVQLP